MWDYKGKLLPKHFEESNKLELLLLRLKSLPAKIIWDVSFWLFEKFQATTQPLQSLEGLRKEIVTKFSAKKILLSPLEQSANVQVAAALPDDVEAI